jgi:hypothetical protein
MRSVFALLLLLAACRTRPLDFDGGVPGGIDLAAPLGSHDLAAPGMRDLAGTPTSCCSTPGNPGNELGVGKYCQDSLDCTGGVNLCASTIAPNLLFCTKACTMNGGNAQCGSGAQCQCAGTQCACVPGECLMPPPGC